MVKAEYRSRADSDVSAEQAHKLVISRLRVIDWLWEDFSSDLSLQGGGGASGRFCSISKHFKHEAKGMLRYAPRYPSNEALPDNGSYDDVLTISWPYNETNYARFAGDVFGQLAFATDAYRGELNLDSEVDGHATTTYDGDTEIPDYRSCIDRFHVVNYFDKVLAKRALGLSLPEIKERLDGEIENVAIHENGILIVATTDMVDRENLIAIDGFLKGLLL